MEINVKTVLFLVLFLLVGIALFPAIISIVDSTTSPTITLANGTVVKNPSYPGQTGATLISLIPLFYVLILLGVPAFILVKYVRRD